MYSSLSPASLHLTYSSLAHFTYSSFSKKKTLLNLNHSNPNSTEGHQRTAPANNTSQTHHRTTPPSIYNLPHRTHERASKLSNFFRFSSVQLPPFAIVPSRVLEILQTPTRRSLPNCHHHVTSGHHRCNRSGFV